MRLHTDTEIYTATYSLAQFVTQLVAGMPRNFKADFGADLRKRCVGLVMRVYEVNTSEARVDILRLMRQEVEAVNLALRLSVDLRLISQGQYSRAIVITESIGKQATGWQKQSERALDAGLSRQAGQRANESGRAAGPQAHRQAHQGYRRQQPQ
jgi:hypothetical protein